MNYEVMDLSFSQGIFYNRWNCHVYMDELFALFSNHWDKRNSAWSGNWDDYVWLLVVKSELFVLGIWNFWDVGHRILLLFLVGTDSEYKINASSM